MKPILAQFQYSESEAFRAKQEVTKAVAPVVRFLPVFGILLLISAGVSKIMLGIGEIPIGPIVFGLILTLLPLITRFQTKKQFKLNPSANAIISWEISKDMLENKTPGSQTSFKWAMLVRIRQVRDGFLLFPQTRIAYWIPKHAFQSEDDVTAFADMARNSVVKFEQR
jgi:phosphotransferase system  glucose/maltose/N-acetylglucosamine-specific IIC component